MKFKKSFVLFLFLFSLNSGNAQRLNTDSLWQVSQKY